MDHESARPNLFACACPSCHNGDGRIQSVTAHDGQRIIGYVCHQCQHTWEQTVDAVPGLFERLSINDSRRTPRAL